MTGPRVLIRVDGTRDIGLGHVVRMRALGLALRDDGAEVMAVTRRNTVGAKLMAEAGFDIHELLEIPDATDLAAAAQFFRPALSIVDTLKTEDADLAALRGGGRLVAFDDWGAGLRAADAVINAIVFHWGRYRRQDVRARLYEGPEYMILPPDVAAVAKRRGAIAPGARRVFVAFGGTDTRDLTARMIDILVHVPGSLEIRANLGPGAQGLEAVRAAAKRSPHRVEILTEAPSLATEFTGTDLAVCGGGNMLYELAAIGIPAAALATEDHEIANIRHWAGVGSAVDLGHWRALDDHRIAATIAALLGNPGRRIALSAAGRKAVDGRGLERCLGVLAGLMA